MCIVYERCQHQPRKRKNVIKSRLHEDTNMNDKKLFFRANEDDDDSSLQSRFINLDELKYIPRVEMPSTAQEYLVSVISERHNVEEITQCNVDYEMFRKNQSLFYDQEPLPQVSEKLKPTKEWQNIQIADFSEVRSYISRMRNEASGTKRIKRFCVKTDNLYWWRYIFYKFNPNLSMILGFSAAQLDKGLEYLIKLMKSTKPGHTIDEYIGRWVYASLSCLKLPLHSDTVCIIRDLAKECRIIRHIITCGHDGDVRIWMGIEDDDPNSHCVGGSALAVCFKEKRLYVATDNHVVQAYTYPAFDKDGIVTRFTAPVTQIKTGSKIEALGCSSENMEAKICSLEGGAPLCVLKEHKGPVLSIAICPRMKYVCTSSGDGVLRVWDIDSVAIVKEIQCVPKINTFYAAKVLCRIDFEPSEGKYLAYPNNREIILIDCESWGQRMAFTHTLIKCAISQCLFSPCGQYLAGSTVAGQIAVWELESGTCTGIIEHPTSHNVTAMAWNPKGNGVLAYCDNAGQLGTLVNCYGKDSSAADADVEMVERNDDNADADDLIQNYESDDDNAISLEKLKNETLGLVTANEESRPPSPYTAPAPASVPPQAPFQPSATPMHLEHRYMCWNDVGIVRCHTGENGESSIDVEFHDTNLHHGIHLKNYLNHTMASLSTTVLALACETPSKLVCISLVGSSKEWSASMPDTEEILCVTAGAAIVGVATDARLLRMFTAMGTQRQVISLAGPVVTLASFNTTVLAVYHTTEPGPSDQHLAMDIIALNGRQVRSKSVPVPLTPGSKLAWLGTTDVGSPCAYDNTGMLRLYDVASGVWIPICDTNTHSRGASDSWFIVSISEPTQKIRAILCRGTSFPPTTPKPIIVELDIKIPVCELDTEKSQYEEQLVRWAHTTADVDVKTARETALKLFALACRSEIEQRALELMELLKDDRLLPLAAKYASRLGRIHLAEKLTDLADTWERDADKLNLAQNHFQELDTQETYDVTGTEDMNASLIIPQKTREKMVGSVAPIKPVPIKSSPGGVRNPFKKQQEAAKGAPSPLSLSERTLVEVHSAEESTEDNDLKPLVGETFMDWFTRNKSLLEQRHSDLTPSELTRQGVRMFKAVQTNGTSAPDNNKRKLDDASNGGDQPVTSAPKQSKLSAFAFQKKT